MHYCSAVTAIVTIGMVLNSTHSQRDTHATSTRKGQNTDVFNLLLGLYKLNPLKSSNVYKTFSDYVMSGGGKHLLVEFDSNESGKKQVKSNLQQIERVIHTKNITPRGIFQEPEFDVENVNIENFNVDVVLNDNLRNEPYKSVIKDNNNDNIDDFSMLFAHIGSNEINYEDDDTAPVMKLVPVTFNGTSYIYNFDKNKTRNKTDTFVNVPNEIEDKGVTTGKSDTADVIVI